MRRSGASKSLPCRPACRKVRLGSTFINNLQEGQYRSILALTYQAQHTLLEQPTCLEFPTKTLPLELVLSQMLFGLDAELVD